MVLSTQKKLISLLAIGLTATLLFGSTFAWQSINQEALNYVKGGVNPGGRLHDDFHNVTEELGATVKTFDKDVYVENFTSAADDGVYIYARIRLDEYLEYGVGAGTGSGTAQSLVTGAKFDDKSTWTTFIPDAEEFVKNNYTAASQAQKNSAMFRDYWTLEWDGGGSAVYMPTFNKNKDSLLADINGTFEGGFVKYALDAQDGVTAMTGHVIQDRDENDADELTDQSKLADLIKYGTDSEYYEALKDNIIVSEAVEHKAAQTIDAGRAMSMKEWLSQTSNGTDTSRIRPCWVYDTDGWFYWSEAIKPGTATGKLLDQIQRTGTAIGEEGDSWYYGLNVVAQFITADDLGNDDSTGFYDTTKGSAPTEDALTLLASIGVKTDGSSGTSADPMAMPEGQTVEVGDEHELRQALESGNDVILTRSIQMDAAVAVEQSTFITLNGWDITPSESFSEQAMFIVSDGAWLDFDGQGAVQAPDDGYAVWVRDNGILCIYDGTFEGGAAAIYVEDGEALILDGMFYLRNDDQGRLLDWTERAEITVCGGTFYNFDPSDAYGVRLLPEDYVVQVKQQEEDTVYTVTMDVPEETPDLPEEEPAEDENPDIDQEVGTEPDASDTVEPDVSEKTEPDASEKTEPDTGSSAPVEDSTALPEASADPEPSPSSAASESTGSVSGISGKAENGSTSAVTEKTQTDAAPTVSPETKTDSAPAVSNTAQTDADAVLPSRGDISG